MKIYREREREKGAAAVCVCARDCLEMNATTVEAPVALLAAPHEACIYLAIAVVHSERISQQILLIFSDSCSTCFSPKLRRICIHIIHAP